MEEKNKRKKLSKKQKEWMNFIFLCFLVDVTWYVLITSNSILWMFLLFVYAAWLTLSGVRLINMERFPDVAPNERFQAEILNGRQTVYPDIHKMKSFILMDDAEKWAKETAEQNETWRIIDLYTGREVRRPKAA
jgi:hypothetical protein